MSTPALKKKGTTSPTRPHLKTKTHPLVQSPHLS